MRKSLLIALLTAIMIGGLTLVSTVHFGTVQASTNVTGIITSDTTWTKANSPYNLTGNVLVDKGVTLTIQAGTTVNLGSYYILVNGTLQAIGDYANLIIFNDGQITFTQYSVGWNDSTDTGCIIEDTNMNSTQISSDVSLKINNVYGNTSISTIASVIISDSSIIGKISSGHQSIIKGNSITGNILVGNASIIAENNITGDIQASNFATIANNKISGSITSGSISMLNNSIVGKITIRDTMSIGSTISNNSLRGGGAVWYYGLAPFPRYPIYPISVIDIAGGPAEIANNTIISQDITTLPSSGYDGGYGITVQVNSNAHIYNNIISGGFVRGINAVGPSIIEENSIINNTGGIAVGKSVYDYGFIVAKGDIIIRNNNLSNSLVGIGGIVINSYYGTADYNFVPVPYNVIIENNLIGTSINGIQIESKATIKNNTITNSSVAIELDQSLSATIFCNNIQSYNQYSLDLQGTSNDINATYNWWGTISTTAISQSIYDFYDDFNLGKVEYVPFLEEPNPQAPVIPTFTIQATAGAGGSINPSGSVSVIYGGSQTFAMTANTDYHIVDVTVDGSSVGAVSSYSFTNVQADHTISATFAPVPTPTPTPTPTPSPTPSVSPSPTPAIPEFPSTVILQVLAGFTVLSVILVKKKLARKIRN